MYFLILNSDFVIQDYCGVNSFYNDKKHYYGITKNTSILSFGENEVKGFLTNSFFLINPIIGQYNPNYEFFIDFYSVKNINNQQDVLFNIEPQYFKFFRGKIHCLYSLEEYKSRKKRDNKNILYKIFSQEKILYNDRDYCLNDYQFLLCELLFALKEKNQNKIFKIIEKKKELQSLQQFYLNQMFCNERIINNATDIYELSKIKIQYKNKEGECI